MSPLNYAERGRILDVVELQVRNPIPHPDTALFISQMACKLALTRLRMFPDAPRR